MTENDYKKPKNVSIAPWTDAEVENLREWQTYGFVHPFTCPNRNNKNKPKHRIYENDLGTLVPTNKGWVCRDCNYTQDWCHPIMLEPVPQPTWIS